MRFLHYQKPKHHLTLCVSKNYKNNFFFFVKSAIQSQIIFLQKNNIEEIELEQSNISESCYITLKFKGEKFTETIRVSGHSNNYDGFDFIVEDFNNIKNVLYFNLTNLKLIERSINNRIPF